MLWNSECNRGTDSSHVMFVMFVSSKLAREQKQFDKENAENSRLLQFNSSKRETLFYGNDKYPTGR